MDYRENQEAAVDEPGVHRSGSTRSNRSGKNVTPAVVLVNDEVYDHPVVDNSQQKDDKPTTKQPKSNKSKSNKDSKSCLNVNTHEERDPNQIAAAIKVTFEDIIGEPDRGLYSFDGPWNASQIAYSCCRLWWYRIITLICGVPAACCWGVTFACLSFCASWCWAPYLRVFQITMSYVRQFIEAVLSCFIEPCMFAYGTYWSRIRVVVRHEGKGEHHIV